MFQILKLITVCSFFFVSACMSKYRSDSQIFDAKGPEGMTAIEVMPILCARGEYSFTTQEKRGMSRPFKFSDINVDGYLSEDEYVGASKHFRENPRGARGFLRASDNNRDRDEALAILVKHGYVRTREEFRSVLIKLNPRLIPSVANANLANLG